MTLIAKIDPNGRRYAGETSEDRVLKRREHFLDVGLQLFGTVGFKAASVRALCREAKLTDRYFYESFDSTEDLLIAVYKREIEKMSQAVILSIGDIASNNNIREVAYPALLAFFSAVQNPISSKIVWHEVLGVSDKVNQVYQTAIQEFGQLMLMMFKSLYPQLNLASSLENALCTAMVGAVSQSAMSWLINDFKTPMDDLIQANMLLLEGLASQFAPMKHAVQ